MRLHTLSLHLHLLQQHDANENIDIFAASSPIKVEPKVVYFATDSLGIFISHHLHYSLAGRFFHFIADGE
jgi:hypothetical protein